MRLKNLMRNATSQILVASDIPLVGGFSCFFLLGILTLPIRRAKQTITGLSVPSCRAGCLCAIDKSCKIIWVFTALETLMTFSMVTFESSLIWRTFSVLTSSFNPKIRIFLYGFNFQASHFRTASWVPLVLKLSSSRALLVRSRSLFFYLCTVDCLHDGVLHWLL